MEVFSLNANDLQLVLSCLCYIYEQVRIYSISFGYFVMNMLLFYQAAFTSTGPEALYEILLNAGFEESHGKIIGKAWASEASEFVNKLKDQRLGYRCLGGIDYHLNMVMGQDDLTRQQEPVALFEFQIFNAPDQVEKKEEKFCVEFNHADLYSLFGQLERIQQQLDGLGKS